MKFGLEISKIFFEKTHAAPYVVGYNMARFVFLSGDFEKNLFYHPIMGNGRSRDVPVAPTYFGEIICWLAILSWLLVIIIIESQARIL